jgi:hypothetical protein
MRRCGGEKIKGAPLVIVVQLKMALSPVTQKRDPVDCCCVSNQNVTTLETNLFFFSFFFFVFFLFLFKGNKMGHLGSAAHHAAAAAAAASSLQFFYQGGGDPHLGQPPPAHMGIPPYQLDPKTAGAMGKIIIIFLIFK